MAADYLTVLTATRPRVFATKRIHRLPDGSIAKQSFGKVKGDRPFLFDAELIAINDLADLATVLLGLRHQPYKLIIRGLPMDASGQPMSHVQTVRRQLRSTPGGVFEMDAAGHHWMMIDFDDLPLPAQIDPDDGEACRSYAVGLLPVAFQQADYVWQWSSGHGLNRTSLRVHLYFWSATRHTDDEFRRWAEWINGVAKQDGVNPKLIDPSLFNAVQIHYCADPLIDDDVDDPVPERVGAHLGQNPTVVVDIPAISWDDHLRQLRAQERAEAPDRQQGVSHPASGGDALWTPSGGACGLRPRACDGEHSSPTQGERYLDYLRRIGDDKDGFHQPIRAAVWHWVMINPPSEDGVIKEVLRHLITEAVNTDPGRDLDHYLSEDYLDSSLRGARDKQTTPLSLQPAQCSSVQGLEGRFEWDKKRNQTRITAEHANAAVAALEALIMQCAD